MSTEPKPLISDDLMREVRQTAREQNREPADIVEEAVAKYLAIQRLASFSERMERRTCEKGIREEDVPRLLEEVRRENEIRNR